VHSSIRRHLAASVNARRRRGERGGTRHAQYWVRLAGRAGGGDPASASGLRPGVGGAVVGAHSGVDGRTIVSVWAADTVGALAAANALERLAGVGDHQGGGGGGALRERRGAGSGGRQQVRYGNDKGAQQDAISCGSEFREHEYLVFGAVKSPQFRAVQRDSTARVSACWLTPPAGWACKGLTPLHAGGVVVAAELTPIV
jgi:hypothetical protein